MYTLEAATRHAQFEAAEKGEPIYVVELANPEADEDAFAELPPLDPVEVEALRRRAEVEARLWREDPGRATALGLVPPWWDMQLSVEGRLLGVDFSDPADPIGFAPMAGLSIAFAVNDGLLVPLLRMASPDGTLSPIADSDAECTRLLALHAEAVAERQEAM